jgi:hypothetical protein
MLSKLLKKKVSPARQAVRDREAAAKRAPGGSAANPIHVLTTAVIEIRASAMPCPQCGGELRVKTHEAPSSGIRRVDVRCQQCSIPRSLWFRLAPDTTN